MGPMGHMGPMGPMADGHLLGKYGQTDKSGWNQQASRQTSHLRVWLKSELYGAIVLRKSKSVFSQSGYGSIPINTIFRGMNIHLPAILMFTRCQGFDPSPHNYSFTSWKTPTKRLSAARCFGDMSLLCYLRHFAVGVRVFQRSRHLDGLEFVGSSSCGVLETGGSAKTCF